MKNALKKYWWVLLIIIVFPLFISFIVSLDMDWAFWNKHQIGTAKDWIVLWVTYFGALGSFAMIFMTYIVLLQNKKQLEEIKRQWDEENRARLNFSIVANQGRIFLKIANIGKYNAYNVKLDFNEEFTSGLLTKYSRKIYEELHSRSFMIESGKSNYYYISPFYQNEGSNYTRSNESFTWKECNTWLDANSNLKIEINGFYCDKYKIKESFSMRDFITRSAIVKDDISLALDKIQKGTVVQNDQYMPIQKSLDIIANSIESIKNKNE